MQGHTRTHKSTVRERILENEGKLKRAKMGRDKNNARSVSAAFDDLKCRCSSQSPGRAHTQRVCHTFGMRFVNIEYLEYGRHDESCGISTTCDRCCSGWSSLKLAGEIWWLFACLQMVAPCELCSASFVGVVVLCCVDVTVWPQSSWSLCSRARARKNISS